MNTAEADTDWQPPLKTFYSRDNGTCTAIAPDGWVFADSGLDYKDFIWPNGASLPPVSLSMKRAE